MRQNSTLDFNRTMISAFALTLIFSLGLACGGMNNPFREYSSKPFNSTDWRTGDAVERGRMMSDLYSKRGIVSGKSKEKIVEILGEPDQKGEVAGREVWQYAMKFSGRSEAAYFSVFFKDEKSTIGGGF
jgi:hypothetical protein